VLPWWLLESENGMEKHIRDLSSLGLLRRFIGMVKIPEVSSPIPGMSILEGFYVIYVEKKLKRNNP
jgi:hypothetical protein